MELIREVAVSKSSDFDFDFKIKEHNFGVIVPFFFVLIIKTIDFRGDLTNTSAKTATLLKSGYDYVAFRIS